MFLLEYGALKHDVGVTDPAASKMFLKILIEFLRRQISFKQNNVSYVL